MKNIKYLLLIGCTAIAFSCTPDYPELGEPLSPSDLKYTVTQDPSYDNKVFLSNESEGVVPYWDYGLGVSNHGKDTIIFPFFGDYWVKFTGFGRAGSLTDSTQIHITENDPSYFDSPAQWKLLTNGELGKTWIFDTTAPIGYYGKEFIAHTGSSDDWSYFPGDCPDWSGFGCGTPWGEMTFDLNGSYNYTVKQKSLTTDEYTITTGKFGYDIKNKAMSIIGAPLLYSANYDAIATWSQAYVFEVSENVLYLGLTAKDGGHIRFKYIPKP
ncbi:MAG: hypothetical protein ABI663_06480 [Chryseolinea sp.]